MNALRHGTSSKIIAEENFVNRYSNEPIARLIGALDRDRRDLHAALQDAISSSHKTAVKSVLRKLSSLERREKSILQSRPKT